MATLTKAGITEAVHAAADGLSKREATEVVETFFEILKQTLERGDKIKIAGFGNFVVRDKKARIGRNPQTGEQIEIAARRVLTFKTSDLLKQKLQDDYEGDDQPGVAPAPAPTAPAPGTGYGGSGESGGGFGGGGF